MLEPKVFLPSATFFQQKYQTKLPTNFFGCAWEKIPHFV